MSARNPVKVEVSVTVSGGSGSATFPAMLSTSVIDITFIDGPNGGTCDFSILDLESDPVYVRTGITLDALLSQAEDKYVAGAGFTLSLSNATDGSYLIKCWKFDQ